MFVFLLRFKIQIQMYLNEKMCTCSQIAKVTETLLKSFPFSRNICSLPSVYNNAFQRGRPQMRVFP